MARKLGTGKAVDDSAARKWATGVKSQVANTGHKSINARYVPLTQISLDPNNPRQLHISPELVMDIARKVPLQPQWLKSSDTQEWWEEYVNTLSEHLKDKALTDYLDIALLATSIKSHDRLLNPVTTYASDSSSTLNLIAGERRFLAHIILGETMIAARILPNKPNDFEITVLQWEENNQRLELSLYERLLNLKQLLGKWEEDKGSRLSVSQLVSLAGLPRVTAHRYLTVIRCDNDALMDAIAKGEISSLRKAAELVSLSKAERNRKLQPSTKQSKPYSIKIKRTKDYTPFKLILETAAQNLVEEPVIEQICELNLDCAEGVTQGFEILLSHLKNKG